MRTFDDIIPPSRRVRPQEDAGEPLTSPPPRSERRFPYLLVIIVIAVIGVSVGVLYFFSGARIEVDPTTDSVLVNGTFTAMTSTSSLPFEFISVEKLATQTVPSTGSETVDTAASGMITVYNEQTKAQPLVAKTRFESTSGLVYRIHAAITVPAAKGGTPGTVSAMVYADKTGDSYNIGATSFTVPGFAGTSEFTKVYAKSTAPMAGGFSGTRPKVDAATAAKTEAALTTTLGGDLKTALAADVPPGYILLPGADFETYTALPPAASSATGNVDVKEKGSALAIVFPESALASAVSAQVLGAAYHGEPVTLTGTSGLTLKPSGSAPNADATSVSFSLSGNVTIVWTVDPGKIASAVAGKTRDAAQVVLSGFPEVKKALIVLRPFWSGTFPADPKGITVVVNSPS
ncbi:MAG: hypothetical protein KGI41_02980 [Patescibacteria group bacterium]|nr:hypothetical protein [Patescibacteria group bacterium]MDE1966178.1 hypothetical protein [Patescibacteria group bacterium]